LIAATARGVSSPNLGLLNVVETITVHLGEDRSPQLLIWVHKGGSHPLFLQGRGGLGAILNLLQPRKELGRELGDRWRYLRLDDTL
jgi:hypothetical protein